ncbi:glycosyltransferase [Chitinophaga sp. NPDC101104]|uniref:glycosyltransferase n=1 Tax=Chitinophaga sp. NPDC101104 TaxID=3390561 RepID=UPI003CFFFA8B
MIRNLHIYPSAFKNESRILREARSILSLGLANQILIAATWEKGLPESEQITDNIVVNRKKSVFNRFPKGGICDILRYLAFMVQVILRYSGKRKPQIVNSHSLSVLFAGVIFKILYGSRLIYDAHELETERSGVHGYRQKLAKILERSLIRRCDKIIVVCDKIAEWYLQAYPFLKGKITVIRNVPDTITAESIPDANLKREFAVPENHLLFVYQGGFFRGRGIETMLSVFEKNTDKHLVFIGYGPYQNMISEYERRCKNIHVKAAVPPAQLIAYTRTADCGISLIENVSLSYYYSLPNKVFEYAMSGVPLIVSDFPEMSNFVNTYKIGWAVNPDIESLGKLLSDLDRSALEAVKPNFARVYREINWQIEEKKLLEAYNFDSPTSEVNKQVSNVI